MEIGDLIRTERTRRGWNQRLLAKSLGVTPGAVAQWELGSTRPKLARLIDICTLFGISAQSFLEPGSPYFGQIVEDQDEIALLALWRKTDPTQRKTIMRILRTVGSVGDADAPKPSRESA